MVLFLFKKQYKNSELSMAKLDFGKHPLVKKARGRLAAASLHSFEALQNLVPLPEKLRNSVQGVRFARAAMGYQISAAIGAAYKMELFGFLAKPRDLAEIAVHCKSTPQAAQVLIDAVVEAGLVASVGLFNTSRYEITAVGRREFLRPRWTSGKGLVDFMNGSWQYWAELPETLQGNSGHPELKVYNPDNPLMAEYIRLQTTMLGSPSRELVAQLDLSHVRNMICGTVGTSFASAVIEAYPEVKLTVSCLPLLIENLPAAMQQWGLQEPQEIIVNSGDALADNWGQQDAYELVFLARKFAFFDPQHGIDYLKKSMQLVPPGGYVVLWEPYADNFDAVPWMRSSIQLVDAMLGEPWPLWRAEQVAEFASKAGYNVQVLDTMQGGMRFVVAQVPMK